MPASPALSRALTSLLLLAASHDCRAAAALPTAAEFARCAAAQQQMQAQSAEADRQQQALRARVDARRARIGQQQAAWMQRDAALRQTLSAEYSDTPTAAQIEQWRSRHQTEIDRLNQEAAQPHPPLTTAAEDAEAARLGQHQLALQEDYRRACPPDRYNDATRARRRDATLHTQAKALIPDVASCDRWVDRAMAGQLKQSPDQLVDTYVWAGCAQKLGFCDRVWQRHRMRTGNGGDSRYPKPVSFCEHGG